MVALDYKLVTANTKSRNLACFFCCGGRQMNICVVSSACSTSTRGELDVRYVWPSNFSIANATGPPVNGTLIPQNDPREHLALQEKWHNMSLRPWKNNTWVGDKKAMVLESHCDCDSGIPVLSPPYKIAARPYGHPHATA